MSFTKGETCLQMLEAKSWIQGVILKDKKTGKPMCKYFGGVPYAQPPTGKRRWQKPVPLDACGGYGSRASPGIFDTKAEVCPQPGKKEEHVNENCLQLNIWIPIGDPPAGGWPVYFYIHGGFLQTGSPNPGSPVQLIDLPTNRYIVVKPAYRLSVLGFLAGPYLPGNYGLWDLRLALEWTWKSMSYFNGNPSLITIGGHSAGAYAAFLQLAYDLRQPSGKQLIKRIIMHSNGPGVQPKSLQEAGHASKALCTTLNISTSLSPKEQLQSLQSMSSATLINAAVKTQPTLQFRAVTDNDFVTPDLIESIRNGKFGKLMKARNISLLIGELSHEYFLYGRYHPPRPANRHTVTTRLSADYPAAAAAALVKAMAPSEDGETAWAEAYGKMYAAAQIHASQRGFIHSLTRTGVEILRYRIEWRAECAARVYGPLDKAGVGHGSDVFVWFYGNGDVHGLSDVEKMIVRTAFLDDFGSFIAGKDVGWELDSVRSVRRLKADGSVDVWRDSEWDQGVRVWETMVDGDEAINTSSKL
jgi:carboxylesterase type B